MPAEVKLVEHLGNETVIKAQLVTGAAVLAVVPGDAALRPGERIGLTFEEANAHLFEAAGSRLVRSEDETGTATFRGSERTPAPAR